jgi:hypothetical protein
MRTIVVVGAVLLAAVRLSAQTVSQPVFLPQQYFVGDIVEARVVIRSETLPEVRVPDQLPHLPWIEIRDVLIVQRADGIEVRIRFQPFFVGTRRLPPIDLGDITIDGVSAFVSSVLPDQPVEPAGIRDQLLLPGTRVLVAVLFAAIVGIPVVVVLAGDWGKRSAVYVSRWYRERAPYRRFQKSVKSLDDRVHELDGKRFYTELLSITRDFMDRRFAAGLRSATTVELDEKLVRIGVPDDARRRIREMFTVGDLVRFANRRVSLEERHAHLEDLRVITRELHRRRTERRDVGP